MAKDYEMDERGVALHNEYSPGDQSTTRFHKAELPANIGARAAFPPHLIVDDEDEDWTSSPMSDNPVDERLATAQRSLEAETERMQAMEDELADAKEDAKNIGPASTRSNRASRSRSVARDENKSEAKSTSTTP